MANKNREINMKQLTIILGVVGIVLGAPLIIISLWSLSGLERVEQKIELTDSKINNLGMEFAEIRGALKAKGIVVDQEEGNESTFSSSADSILSPYSYFWWYDSSEPDWNFSPFTHEDDTLFYGGFWVFPVDSTFEELGATIQANLEDE